jgi:MFS family permease
MNTLYKSKHYPWFLVAMLFTMYTASTVSTNSLPIFYPEIKKDFGWTHAQVSEPASYYFIFIAFIVPLVGFLLVRFSPKLLMAIGFSIAFLATTAITFMSDFSQYFAIYFFLSVAISFSGLMPSMVIITNWFDKNRGLAVGLFLLGSSIGGIVFPEFSRYLMKISGNNWRYSLSGVSILAMALSFIPWFFIKAKPNSIDNNIAQNTSEQQALDRASIIETAKTPTFWLILFITASFWFCGFSVLNHLQLYLADNKFDFNKAIQIRDWFFIASIVGKVAFGYFSDTFDKRNILIFGTICLILGIWFLKMIPINHDYAYVYALVYGFGYSGAFTMIQLTVADYYKGATFSKVLGFVSAFDAIGGFLGVRLLGLYRTADGNYDFGIMLLLGMGFAALSMAILLRYMSVRLKY